MSHASRKQHVENLTGRDGRLGALEALLWSRQEKGLAEAGLWDRRPCAGGLEGFGGGFDEAEVAAWPEHKGAVVGLCFRGIGFVKTSTHVERARSVEVWSRPSGESWRCLSQSWQLWVRLKPPCKQKHQGWEHGEREKRRQRLSLNGSLRRNSQKRD